MAGDAWTTAIVGPAAGGSSAPPGQPVTVALTLSCLYSVAAGSVPSNAYYPRSILGLVIPLFAAVLGKLLAAGKLDPAAETVVLNTGEGLKTVDAVAPVAGPTHHIRPSLRSARDAGLLG